MERWKVLGTLFVLLAGLMVVGCADLPSANDRGHGNAPEAAGQDDDGTWEAAAVQREGS